MKNPDLANNAITTSKISNGALQTSDLADNSVISDKIVDGTITAVDLSHSAISSTSIKLPGISNIIFNTCSIDFSSVHAHQLVFTFCPVTGARIGDEVIVTNQDLALDLLKVSVCKRD